MPEQTGYSDRDEAVASKIAGKCLSGDEPPLQKLAVRASAVAIDRWGMDLENGPRRHGNFNAVLEDSAVDTLRHYSDDDAHIDGLDGLVFEGRPINSTELFDAAMEVTDVIEAEGKFDRNSPGGLVETVDHVE